MRPPMTTLHLDTERNGSNNGVAVSEPFVATTFDPALGVWSLTRDLRVLFATPVAVRLLLDDPNREPSGETLGELVPAAVLSPIRAIVEQVVADGRPRALRGFWGDARLRSTFVRNEDDRIEGDVIVVSRPDPIGMPGATETGDDLVDLPFAYFRELSGLSTRQLEVLSLMGLGLSRDEIAKRTYRSPKTIDTHQATLRRKLNASSRVELSMLAQRLGLTQEIAQLPRVEPIRSIR